MFRIYSEHFRLCGKGAPKRVSGQYDALAIGGGIAGVSAAIAAQLQGVLIEKSVLLGGLKTLFKCFSSETERERKIRMKEIFESIPKIQYEGPQSRNPLAFKFYDPEKVILGKTMKEHLPFAMAWWHNLCGTGRDMFGDGTANKGFSEESGTMNHAFKKADAGFEFMEKLGIEYFCFHDLDLVPEAKTLTETNGRLDRMTGYLKERMTDTGKKLLWGTANLFNHPRYMNGAGSSNSADIFCHAAAQIKKALDITTELGGKGYVFWGGREGYETLLILISNLNRKTSPRS